MKPAPILSMSGLSVAHPRSPGVAVVEGVDWEVRPGECWVVTGLQGSGKTVLLETAAGLHPVMSGELRLFGERLTVDETPEMTSIRRRVGLVFDGSGRLFPGMSVWENVTLPLRYHQNLGPEAAMEATADVFRTLGLEPYAQWAPGRLSRAWARRVALARALVLRPEILLLDNPLTGMDPEHIRWWRSLLQQFVAGHPLFGGVPRAVLIAGDTVAPLLSLGTAFALVHGGRWRTLGGREAVLGSTDPFVQGLLRDAD